ncbi:MAG TPA: tRNA uracil 4-sulfurtransferase ThiI [Spirochaetia bacterium]|nr:tRNA uracil 4-sulfurtransferase ThiI [Spirochaetia bacterium]
MECLYLIKPGEMTLKGQNLPWFEKKLKENIKRSLSGIPTVVTGKQGRFYVKSEKEYSEEIARRLSKVFGIHDFTEAKKVTKDIREIEQAAVEVALAAQSASPFSTFKVVARRSDKSFPLDSYGIAAEVGRVVLEALPHVKVDVHNPEFILGIEIRESAFVYGRGKRGAGGMPVGSAGKGLLLLSGGIDSPVAGYLLAKRGLKIDSIYFHAYPYTSNEALEKVKTLASILSPYTGGMKLFVVPFTDTQLALKSHADPREVTILMRLAMVAIADRLAKEKGYKALVTGESLSQVASQTPESIRVTQSATDLPIFRPLIGFDKEEIVSYAQKIGTFETSILPYADCCTLFAPEHPLIHPDFEEVRHAFTALHLEQLLEDAIARTECIICHDRKKANP